MPPALVRHIKSLGMQYVQQVVYMARALYSHCSLRVTGVPRVCCPPTDHIDRIQAVPLKYVFSLARATLTPLPAAGLHAWLTSVVMYGSRRVYCTHNVYPSCKTSGRKGRRHSVSTEARVVADKALTEVSQVFAGIMQLSPRFAPRFSCYVASIASGRISLVLSAVPPAPFDE